MILINKFASQSRPPNNKQLGIFSNPQAVPFIFKDVGLITVDGNGWGKSEGELLGQAVLKAHKK